MTGGMSNEHRAMGETGKRACIDKASEASSFEHFRASGLKIRPLLRRAM
jgi:hypothetical protein